MGKTPEKITRVVGGTSSAQWIEDLLLEADTDLNVKVLNIFHDPSDETELPDEYPSTNDPSIAAVVFTGSVCNVTDIMKKGYTWAQKGIEFIRALYEQSIPMFGVCFGHQLISYALNGVISALPANPFTKPHSDVDDDDCLNEVTENYFSSHIHNDKCSKDSIFEVGTRVMYLYPEATSDRLFGPIFKLALDSTDVEEIHHTHEYPINKKFVRRESEVKFLAQTSHGQSVLHPPPMAKPLAYNNIDAYHALSYGRNVWSTQFHPEIPAAAMPMYAGFIEDTLLRQDGITGNLDVLLEHNRHTRISRLIVVNFARVVADIEANKLQSEIEPAVSILETGIRTRA